MNREIKFRAWCNTKKDFVDPIYNNVNLSHIFELGFYEMEQFTGLTDKNGTEIYEGDILQFGNRAIQEVKFENGCFTVFDEPLGWDFDNFEDGIRVPIKCDLRFCEVIGNIHSNPELL